MFLIDKNKELTPKELGSIIQQFKTREYPRLQKYYDYYEGKQQITMKVPTDVGKPCNKIVTNYCYDITQNYLGYLAGIPIAYLSDKNYDDIYEVLDYNDYHSEDAALLKQALIFGKAFEITYVDEDARQRFKVLDTRECIEVYDNTLNQNLLYVIRFYPAGLNQNDYIVEVYDSSRCQKYKANSGFSTFELIEEIPHFYKQVPVTVFTLNSDAKSIFDQVMSLQDAYNTLLSDEVDDFEAFADAYLVLKGVMAEEDDLRSMKENRVLMMDTDADVSYLTKSISDTQIQNMLVNINDQIHKLAKSPDFNDDKFMSASGIAMRYKLVGFENVSSAIEANMKKAIQKRLELICELLSLTGSEAMWRDVNIVFTRNLPVNIVEIAQVVNSLRGLVSDATLLSQLPFIDNPQDELDRIKAQKEENMSLYTFDSGNNDEGKEPEANE